jgi:hypothetical protein
MILAAYHLSGYKCFEYYYRQVIKKSNESYFPKAPSYERFLTLLSRCYSLMWLWSLHCCVKASRTGLYIIDSKRLEVCHLKREHQHRVFSTTARKGKSSTGWFYGFKLHLVINDRGQIVNWTITAGNVADNNAALLQQLLKELCRICIGDKGYFTSLFEWFYQQKLLFDRVVFDRQAQTKHEERLALLDGPSVLPAQKSPHRISQRPVSLRL